MPMWVAEIKSRKRVRLSVGVVALSAFLYSPAFGIDVDLTAQQIQAAFEQGKAAAQKNMSPESFYVRFGMADEVQPKGFLITKIGALSAMATHMALRGMQPSEADVTHVLEDTTMIINITIFGNQPDFAVDSYMVLDQGGKTIKPVTVRFDAQASRSVVWPKSPRFKAKVVARFKYGDFAPKSKTVVKVYSGTGEESHFPINFNEID